MIPLCFFLSGCAGLMLQVVWARMLSLHLGGSAEAVTAVVTAYMAGLGLGSLIGGARASRVRQPLRAYAGLEMVVALFAVASPFILQLPEGLYRLAHDQEEVARALPFAVRFVTSMLLLVLPTLAMGATLPLLVEHLTRRGGAFGTRVATLYGINTLGAVAGALVAGFVLLPRLGNTATLQAAAGLDVLVAVLILLGPGRLELGVMELARPRPEGLETRPALRAATREQRAMRRPFARQEEPAAEPPVTAGARRLAMAAFAISGALAMTYELGWTRRLATLIGSSVYSFSLLLAVFLAGLGIGALLAGPLLRAVRRPLAALAVALGLTGAAALAGTALLHRVPEALRALLATHHRDPQAILTGQLGIAALVLLPAALLLGAIFPLAARVAHREGESGGAAIGRAYAINTAGTVLGAAAAGLLLLPSLGALRSLEVAAWAHVALGVALALAAPVGIVLRVAIVVVVVALAAGVRWMTPAPDPYQLNYGIVSILRDIDRGAGPPPSLAEMQRREIDALRLLSLEEGRSATVAVISRWDQRQLVINGKVDASSGDPTEVLLGQLPMILADSVRRALVIGYGSGITTHSVLTHGVPRVETVEIEPEVMRAGRWFADLNGWSESLLRPAVSATARQVVHLEDGRTHLAYTRHRYDMIVSEPSNPWIAGINNLFTAEFYRLVRQRLAPGGVFCQWVHGYDMTRETLGSLLATLRAAFPGAEVYRQNLDFLVIWKQSGAFLTRERLARAFADSTVRADLARVGFAAPEDLFALYLGPIESVAPADGRANTDDNGFVEFRAPLDLLRRGGERAWNTPRIAALRLERYDPRAQRADILAAFARGVTRRRDLERMRELEAAMARAGAAEAARAMSAAIARLTASRRDLPRALRLMAQAETARQAGNVARTESLLREAVTVAPDHPELLFRHGQAAVLAGDVVAAERSLRAALAERERQLVWHLGVGEPYQAELLLGIVTSMRGDLEGGLHFFHHARARNPWLTGAHYLIASTLHVLGRSDEARQALAAGLAVDPDDAKLKELETRLTVK